MIGTEEGVETALFRRRGQGEDLLVGGAVVRFKQHAKPHQPIPFTFAAAGVAGAVGVAGAAGAVEAPCAGIAPARAGAGTVSGKWQATTCPGASSLGGGSSFAHRSVARGHLVRNRHPLGGLIGDGGSPLMVAEARVPPGSVDGIDSSSAWVYGCSGWRYTASPGPTSHSLPRYITATRSLTCLTRARSCAMNR